jgi:hypothetical protein
VTLRIISGGQTGADRTALEVARELGIETGGWAPHGWRTDAGPDPTLAAFGLRECGFGYRVRTRWNVRDADATVIFGYTDTPGTMATLAACLALKKPIAVNLDVDHLHLWLETHQPRVLNVAGNRRRTNPEITTIVETTLRPALCRYIGLGAG